MTVAASNRLMICRPAAPSVMGTAMASRRLSVSPAGLARPSARLSSRVLAARLAEEVEGREHRADRHTRDGAGSGERAVAEAIHDEPGKAEAEEELAQCLDDLADGRGGHISLPLEEAAAGGDVAHKEHGRAERKDGPHGIRVLHHVGQLLRDDQHQRRADDTDGQEGHEGDAVDLTHLFAVVQRAGLGDHAAHGDGQAVVEIMSSTV